MVVATNNHHSTKEDTSSSNSTKASQASRATLNRFVIPSPDTFHDVLNSGQDLGDVDVVKPNSASNW